MQRRSAAVLKESPVPKRKLTWRSLALRAGFVSLLTLIFAEISMRAGYAVFRPGVTVASLVQEQYDLTQHVMIGRRNTQPNVLHPYVGFVVDPTRNSKFNAYGFWQVDGPLIKRSSNSIVIGVTGGSVARDLCEYSATTLREELSRKFPQKQIKIVCLAQEGFREPQLAMTVNYFLTLGAEFDAVVSLSGFNEAVLHPAESPEDDLWIGYPRAWNVQLTDTEDPELNRLIWEGQTFQEQRTSCAAQAYRFRKIPLLAIHGVWSAVDAHYRKRLVEAAANLLNSRHKVTQRYANIGPATPYSSSDGRRNAQIEMWLAGTRQIQRLCKGTNARLLLCLQPNLHDNNRTKMTDEEQQLIRGSSVYQRWVSENYAHFAAAGVRLRSEGISFHDLRDLYDEVPSSVYRDECCHFNQNGNDLLARRLAALVADELNRSDTVP